MTTPAADWRTRLFARRLTGVRFSTEPIERVVDVLLPGLRTRPPFVVVQVVGTNGKGSTAAMIDHGLRELGHGPVGLYTSPHLERVGERIRIDGQGVADAAIEAAIDDIAAAEAEAGVALSFFEVLTAIALRCFVAAGCTHVVLEAGLGGRADATSVLRPQVVAIAHIAMDHMAMLGDTITAIAVEKAAVLRPGVAAAFSVAQEPEARAVIEARARAQGVALGFVEPLAAAPRRLPGAHQRDNAVLALAVLRELDSRARAVDFDDVVWPGRLEPFSLSGGGAQAGKLWLDVAHNPDGIAALCRALDELDIRPSVIVFGTMADKPADDMARPLRSRAAVWLVAPAREGAFDMRAVAAPGEPCFAGPDEPELLAAIHAQLQTGATVLVCGSNYLVGGLRARLRDPSGDVDGAERGDPIARTAPERLRPRA